MKDKWESIEVPASAEAIKAMRAGKLYLLQGTIFTARDKAHQRIASMVAAGEEPPVDLKGQMVYYVGPSPAPQGKVIGAAGPTTSYRMDPFTETMLKLGVRGMIGKGTRSEETRLLLQRFGAVYFSSFGGAGAYLSKRIVAASVVAFEDLGPEAIYRLELKDFPVVVVNDSEGGYLYEAQL